MGDDKLREILLEDVDASAEPCHGATLEDLDADAVETFREYVAARAREARVAERYRGMDAEQLINDLGLILADGALTRAAILLLGTDAALRRWARNAEVIFEYRRVPTATRYEHRLPLRRAILLAIDELWEEIRHHAFERPIEITDGARVVQRPRFPERSVREAILNAITHRDYHDPESVIVRMSPDTFEVTSPGPFPATVTPENIADQQYRRNRVLAEALERCGFIERSGQGVDLMIEAAVRHGQPIPTFEEPHGRQVRVTLFGNVNLEVLRTLQHVPDEVWNELAPTELKALDAVRRRARRRDVDPKAARRLLERGLIEPSGPGDAAFVYSTQLAPGGQVQHFFFPLLRALLQFDNGATLAELREASGMNDVEALKRSLQWLRRNGFAYTTGRTRGARWHARVDALQEAFRDLVD